jgi:hypothetical protein
MTTESPIRRAVQYITTTKTFSLPHWVLYVAGVLILLALIFGAIQQARIMRWEKLIRAAKERIVSLEADKAQAHYRGVSQTTSRAISSLEGQDQKTKEGLDALRKKKEEEKKRIEQLDPADLARRFKEEGF